MARMDSAFGDNYRFLARYSRWFNQRLYAACDLLGDDARQQDRDALWFDHGTLNHLVWGRHHGLLAFAAQGRPSRALGDDLLALPPGASYGTDARTRLGRSESPPRPAGRGD